MDSLLKALSGQADTAEDVQKTLVMTQLSGVKGRLTTPNQQVVAAIIEAQVGDSLCAPLRRVENLVPSADPKTATEFSILFRDCKPPQ